MKTFSTTFLPPIFALAFSSLFTAGAAAAGGGDAPALESYRHWDPEIVEIFRSLPIQDEGRVKPLDTFAQFRMFRLHGKRSMRFTAGSGESVETFKIGPTQWMLDLLFRPQIAGKMPTFQVNDSRIVIAFGIEAHEKRRGRYSYEEILPGRAKLSELGMKYAEIEAGDRTYDQGMIVNLARNVSDFEFLSNQFAFARKGIEVERSALPEGVFAGSEPDRVAISDLLRGMGKLREHVAGDRDKITEGVELAMHQVEFYSQTARGLAIFPPEKQQEKWLSGGEMIAASVGDDAALEWGLPRIELIEALAGALEDPGDFATKAGALKELVVADATERGEYGRVGMEVAFYKAKFFYRSLLCFLLGFVLLSFSWLAPASGLSKRLTAGVVACAILGELLLVTGIVWRSIIQSRAPIYNLYDTIIFIAAIAVLVALLMEYANREGLGLAVAVFLGGAGMFLAMRFEVKDANDTMESMRAVLASNFWLATHVTTINIGYSAGFLASGIAHFYLFARLFKRGDSRERLRTATRMTYGAICFCLFFGLVGTVLGGIWANYSWGRFWGWDPKENGALMIVLWTLIILHARMGGYIRDLGVNLCAIIGGMIVSFSWWGVNLLGVGLHGYGFTEGVWAALYTFWAIELLMIATGIWLWKRDRGGTAKSSGGKAAAAAA
ncbi:MAG: cytochrome c biogenesis protein [Verrucomicrobiales bacterium]